MVFSLGTSSVTPSPELVVMFGAAGAGAMVGVPSPTAPGSSKPVEGHRGGSYRHSPTGIRIYGRWAADLADSPGSGEQ